MNNKSEIGLTEIEVELVAVFIRRKILSDSQIANILSQLASKLSS